MTTAAAANSTIVRAVNGVEVRLRMVPATEAGHVLDAVFDGLSARSRFLRFHAPIRRLTESARELLVDLDSRQRAAIVAEVVAPDRQVLPVGLLHLAGDGHGTAETAIEVVDHWQRRGIGRLLLDAAAELATRLGFTQLRGAVLPENEAMKSLLRSTYPAARSRFDGDVWQFVAPLGAAAWTITDDDVLADLLYRGEP